MPLSCAQCPGHGGHGSGRAVQNQRHAESFAQHRGQRLIIFERPLLGSPSGQRTRQRKRPIGQAALGSARGKRKGPHQVRSARARRQIQSLIDDVDGRAVARASNRTGPPGRSRTTPDPNPAIRSGRARCAINADFVRP